MRAEAAGDPGPWRQQALLDRSRWEADALRDLVRDDVVETLADPDAVLVIDETGFLKQGQASCGVGRLVRGRAPGHGLRGEDHQLPDRGVRGLCVPARTCLHRPRPLLAQGLDRRPGPHGGRSCPARNPLRHQASACAGDDRAGACGRCTVPLGSHGHRVWVWRGRDQAETGWQRLCAGRACDGSVTSFGDKPPVAGTAEAIAAGLEESAWQRLSAGDGTNGERLYDWAYCELADLDAGEHAEGETGLWMRGLLIRRSIADGQLAFFSTWCPVGTGIERLVTVEGHRWAIEDAFETAKTELGLDHNETRSWHGWHRHVSLVMLAFALMAAVRHHANQLPPPKKTKSRVGQAAR